MIMVAKDWRADLSWTVFHTLMFSRPSETLVHIYSDRF